MAIGRLEDLVGRRLLVGITYLDAADQVVEQVEFCGLVLSVDPLVSIDCGDEEPFTLPPAVDAYDIAGPGEYRLRSTGEVVVDPDFVTIWTVTAPD